jgi:hypothetical protein
MSRWRWVTIAASLAAASAGLLYWKVTREVERALQAPAPDEQLLQFTALAHGGATLPRWGGTEVAAVAVDDSGLVAAGASGVFSRSGALDSGLPTLRASALATWRGRLVVGLESGGLYRRAEGRWEEARSGFGALHVRALAETDAGELLVGAREGLYRTAWGATRLTRLDTHPVRGLAVGSGFVLAAGEQGLRHLAGVTLQTLPTPDPWVESVALVGDSVFAVTAAGLARGDLGQPLAAVRGGEDVIGGIALGDRFVGLTESGDTLRRFDVGGRATEEALTTPARRLFAAGDALLADTAAGLRLRQRDGWVEALRGPDALPWVQGHVSALALLGDRLVAGRFDGGLAVAARDPRRLVFRDVEGSAAWGVNALLPAGGTLYVASLRGAARFDGQRLAAIDGPGAAFSLAQTPEGVAIGYAQGVLVPGQKLLSAFHGLPGNQATALAGGTSLFVGTPSGLGAIRARHVEWRVTPGEGKLPHPWVTALLDQPDALYVGTYGGGVARRLASGRFEPLLETAAFKVAAGALVEAGGRVYLGTEGRGLFRLSRDRERFDPVRVALPSPRVTALLPAGDVLYVGTDEGLTRLPLTSDLE